MIKPILDPCCGAKMFWFDKNNPLVLYCDNRKIETTANDGRAFVVSPDVICDFTDLPFPNNFFMHVVFDPPQTDIKAFEQAKADGYSPDVIIAHDDPRLEKLGRRFLKEPVKHEDND